MDPIRSEEVSGESSTGHQVVLVAMPWCPLFNPSIQVGILNRLLRDAGIATSSRTYSLAFLDHLANRAAAQGPRITVQDYLDISIENCMRGLGDWLFAVPPFPDPSRGDDHAYLGWLKRAGASDRVLELAPWIRNQVPSFLDACVSDILRDSPQVVGFTTGFNQTVPALVLGRRLKERLPELKVVFGGADCDGPMGEAVLRAFDWVDVVVRAGSGSTERVARPARSYAVAVARANGSLTLTRCPAASS